MCISIVTPIDIILLPNVHKPDISSVCVCAVNPAKPKTPVYNLQSMYTFL